jgi:putative cell wall-binding protein
MLGGTAGDVPNPLRRPRERRLSILREASLRRKVFGACLVALVAVQLAGITRGDAVEESTGTLTRDDAEVWASSANDRFAIATLPATSGYQTFGLLDRADGSITDIPHDGIYLDAARPLDDGTVVYSESGRLMAWDRNTGARVISTDGGYSFQTAPAGRSAVFVGSETIGESVVRYHLRRYDFETSTVNTIRELIVDFQDVDDDALVPEHLTDVDDHATRALAWACTWNSGEGGCGRRAVSIDLASGAVTLIDPRDDGGRFVAPGYLSGDGSTATVSIGTSEWLDDLVSMVNRGSGWQPFSGPDDSYCDVYRAPQLGTHTTERLSYDGSFLACVARVPDATTWTGDRALFGLHEFASGVFTQIADLGPSGYAFTWLVSPSADQVRFEADGAGPFDSAYCGQDDRCALVWSRDVTVPPRPLLNMFALGDSYSSGEGAVASGESYLPGTDTFNWRWDGIWRSGFTTRNMCHRSPSAYPERLFSLYANGGATKTVACSGARIRDLYSGQYPNSEPGVAGARGQLVELGEFDADVVTMGIGGNDVPFTGMIFSCITYPQTCADDVGYDRAIDDVGDALIDVLEDVKDTAPTAEIYLFGYPRVLDPETDYSVVLGDCNVGGQLEAAERDALIGWISRLNFRMEAAADSVGVHFVDVEDALDGHELCTDAPYVNGFTAGDEQLVFSAASFHPTSQGHAEMADAFMAQYGDVAGANPNPAPGVEPLPVSDATGHDMGTIPVLLQGSAPSLDASQHWYVQDAAGATILDSAAPVTLHVEDLAPDTTITLQVLSDPMWLADATTDGTGAATFAFAVPEIAPGAHHLVVTGTSGTGRSQLAVAKVVVVDGTRPQDGPTSEVDPSDGDGPSGGSSGDPSGAGTSSEDGTPSVAVIRIAGPDRIATSIAASRDAFPSAAAGAVLASSTSFSDALVGGPLAAHIAGPLLLTGGSALDARVGRELDRLLQAGAEVHVLGGTAAISAAVEQQVTEMGFSVVRHGGIDRYGTAVAVARDALHPSTLLLATGTDFPDALAAGATAAHLDGAVLLTRGDELPKEVARYIADRPDAERIAVGGAAASADPHALRVVGADRYATAVALAERFFTAHTAFALASGLSWPDALSGGAHAAHLGVPLLLTPPDSLAPAVQAFSRDTAPERVWAYGGTNAIADRVLDQLAQAW